MTKKRILRATPLPESRVPAPSLLHGAGLSSSGQTGEATGLPCSLQTQESPVSERTGAPSPLTKTDTAMEPLPRPPVHHLDSALSERERFESMGVSYEDMP